VKLFSYISMDLVIRIRARSWALEAPAANPVALYSEVTRHRRARLLRFGRYCCKKSFEPRSRPPLAIAKAVVQCVEPAHKLHALILPATQNRLGGADRMRLGDDLRRKILLPNSRFSKNMWQGAVGRQGYSSDYLGAPSPYAETMAQQE
jgi:hypothetical protein